LLKYLLLPLVLLTACGSSSDDKSPSSLYNSWVLSTDVGTEGWTFKSNKTYSYIGLRLTSSNTANAYEELGSIDVTDTTVTFTPQKWSCPSADPQFSATYSLGHDSLDLAFPTRVALYSLNTAAASTNANLALGCFDTTGAFTPHALGTGD
jgi:hypothetical protein